MGSWQAAGRATARGGVLRGLSWRWAAAAALLAAAQPTVAVSGPSLIGWTNGSTLGDGQNSFLATAGYPGLSVGYLRGLSKTMDAGIRLSWGYAGEGVPDLSGMSFKAGLDFKLWFDLGLPVAVGVRAMPGVVLSYPTGFSVVGAAVPLELSAGLPLMPELMVHASISSPLSVTFWSGYYARFTTVQVPVLGGGGAEYRLDPSLSL